LVWKFEILVTLISTKQLALSSLISKPKRDSE